MNNKRANDIVLLTPPLLKRFFRNGDSCAFHIEDCSLVSGSYINYSLVKVSSIVQENWVSKLRQISLVWQNQKICFLPLSLASTRIELVTQLIRCNTDCFGVIYVVLNNVPSRDLPVDSSFDQLQRLVLPLSAKHCQKARIHGNFTPFHLWRQLGQSLLVKRGIHR